MYTKSGLFKGRSRLILVALLLTFLFAVQGLASPLSALALETSAPSSEGAEVSVGDGAAEEGDEAQNGVSEADFSPAPTEEGALPVVDRQGSSWTDIAAAWSGGKLTITEPGQYFLSEDVAANTPLILAAPPGGSIVLDFDGHTANVSGNVICGIDVSTSSGSIKLVDNTSTASAVKNNLVVRGQGVSGAVCGILQNLTPETEGMAPHLESKTIGVDVAAESRSADFVAGTVGAYALYIARGYQGADAPTDIQIENCAFSARVVEGAATESAGVALDGQSAGIAAGVYTELAGITFKGIWRSGMASSSGTCDWYSIREDTFVLGAGFVLPEGASVRVYAAGAAAGTRVAGFGVDGPDAGIAERFTPAGGDGVQIAADEAGLYIVAAPPAEETIDPPEENPEEPDEEEPANPTGEDPQLPTNEDADAGEKDSEEKETTERARTAEPTFGAQAMETDITNDWRSGDYTINKPGIYVLSSDFTTTNTLTIEVPYDEDNPAAEVTLDFKGHSVAVDTSVSLRGIQVKGTRVPVKITSSENRANKSPNLTVLGTNINLGGSAAATVYGIYSTVSSSPGDGFTKQVLAMENIDIEVRAQTVTGSGTGLVHTYGFFQTQTNQAHTMDTSLHNCSFTARMTDEDGCEIPSIQRGEVRAIHVHNLADASVNPASLRIVNSRACSHIK